MAGVEVEVRSQLLKIVEDLEQIKKSSLAVSNSLKATSEGVGKTVDDQTKKVNTSLTTMGSIGRRISNQLFQDFKALTSIGALTSGLSLANQFKGSVSEALNLSDTVRRLGHVFGIAKSDFASFQSSIQKGFGDIGLSSEAAANAMQGLSETPVRGQENIVRYAKTSGQLAAISGEKGNEGAVAKGLVETIQSRGGNVQSPQELAKASNEVLQIQQATGKKATEITTALSELYAHTNADFKKQMSNGGAVTLASAALKAGPGATEFLESFIGKTKFQRAGMEAQGLGKLIGPNGALDPKAFAATMAEANRRSPGNAEFGLTTMGIQPEQAKGFMRLAEVMRTQGAEINGAKNQKVDLNDTFQETMGAADSFGASMNRVKGEFSGFIATLTQGATDLLHASSQSGLGAGATVAGAGVFSAVATGMGLKGLAGALGLGGGAAASSGAAAGGMGGLMGTAGGFGAGAMALGALGVGAAGAAGYGVGMGANYGLNRFTQGTTSEGVQGNAVERLIAKIDQMIGSEQSKRVAEAGKVEVALKIREQPKNFKATPMPSRGGGQ